MLEIIQLAVLHDNYIYVAHDAAGEKTVVIDPAVAEPVLEVLRQKGWGLDYIFNTHHHWDHIGANNYLKQQTGCRIFASCYDKKRIDGVDTLLHDGDCVQIGEQTATVLETPGHTLGHIVYYFANSAALFCGDTLFSLGCGRLFEGTAQQMRQSLAKIARLPANTRIFCAHEYTQANAAFALSIDSDNPQLHQASARINKLANEGKPTVPSTVQLELACNPFLRAHKKALRQAVNMPDAHPDAVFAEIRRRKDNFG